EAAAQKARIEREDATKAAELKRLEDDAKVRAETQRVLNQASIEAQARLRELEIMLINAQSAATVAERQAVQRQLVEAMTALGDKLLLTEVAQNMNLVSLFKGKDVGTILREVVGGTKVIPTLRALIDSASEVPAEKGS